jgi:electron transfer flavoprotein beta subunit
MGRPMKIYVCVKHVPDSAATITVKGEAEIEERITFLMNPYDEHAVTEARRLKEFFPETEVIVVCFSKPEAEGTLRSALAMGADRGLLITSGYRHDPIMTARVLKAAIAQDGQPDLVLTGRESIDAEGMQTMFRLAHLFNIPAATNVVKIDIEGDEILATCEKEAGAREVLKLGMPCVLAAGKGLNIPRYPTLPDIVKSRKKEIKTIDFEKLGIPKPAGRVELVHLTPVLEKRIPKEITGTTMSIAEQIVTILKDEARVI